MAKRYTVSDGKMVLTLEDAPEGGFVVTSPMEPALITEADSVGEAFEMARDAMKTLHGGTQETVHVILRACLRSSVVARATRPCEERGLHRRVARATNHRLNGFLDTLGTSG